MALEVLFSFLTSSEGPKVPPKHKIFGFDNLNASLSTSKIHIREQQDQYRLKASRSKCPEGRL